MKEKLIETRIPSPCLHEGVLELHFTMFPLKKNALDGTLF